MINEEYHKDEYQPQISEKRIEGLEVKPHRI